MTAPARTAAYHALRAISSGRDDLPTALAHARSLLGDDRDRALTGDIVTGTLRWQGALDHVIETMAGRQLARLDIEIILILRLSLYQLLHLTRVPASAVVDDAVDLTRAVRKPSAAGFVNAVLRRTLRSRSALPLPSRPASPADRDAALSYLSITHSHPRWLVSRWLARHGFEAAERWVQFNNQTPSLTLRVNTLRSLRAEVIRALDEHDVRTEPTVHAPHGLVVIHGNPLRLPPTGTFVVQDEASQLIPLVVAPRPGEHVLDLCASPGGKSTAMAAEVSDAGLVVACDVRPRRLQLLSQTVRTLGARRVAVVRVPTEDALPFTRTFHRALVDAPCSGLGTIRRDPDIRWRRTEAELEGLARNQLRLLSRAAELIVTGGRLVYSTCSSEPEENEAVVDRFLAEHPEYTLLDLRQDGNAAVQPFVDDRGMMRTLPFRDGLEAFFAAAVTRRR